MSYVHLPVSVVGPVGVSGVWNKSYLLQIFVKR